MPLRSALASFADVVPEGARDTLFGETRDASHFHGLLVALGLLLGVIVVGTKVVSAWQKAATRAYLAGRPDEGLRAAGWFPAAAAAVFGVLSFLVWASQVHIDQVPTRTVTVERAVIVEAPEPTPSPGIIVRFVPVGTGDDTPVVVKVGKRSEDVRLDDGVAYRITATATGGQDCTVSAEPPERSTRVTVRRAAAGAVLPKGKR